MTECEHKDAVIEDPCCGFTTQDIDCACGGSISVYCPDCLIDDYEASRLIENYMDREL